MDPTIFGDDVVDNVDDVLAAHVNNLRAWSRNFIPLIPNMNAVSDTDGVTTLSDTDLPFQTVDALGDTDYTVYLPTASTDNHPFFIFNSSTDASNIFVKDASSDAIDTIIEDRAALFLSNGTEWVSVNSMSVTATATPTASSIPISDTDGTLDSWVTTAASSDFPVSPSAGDQYFRTDLGLDCYYDGTRWLTKNEYAENTFESDTDGLLYDSTGSTYYVGAGIVLSVTYPVYITRVASIIFVTDTNDGSNYWNLLLYGYQQNYAGGTLFATISTATITVSEETASEVAASTNLHGTDNKIFKLKLTRSGSPGNIYIESALIYYRKIIT